MSSLRVLALSAFAASLGFVSGLEFLAHAGASITQSVSIVVDKKSVSWLSDGSYEVRLGVSDKSGERAERLVFVSADGTKVTDSQGKSLGVAVPAAWLSRLRSFSSSMDAFIATLAASGKVGL